MIKDALIQKIAKKSRYFPTIFLKMAFPEPPRILSIQSHVIYGYCGNKSAVFPLQVLGFEVDFINSVQFSNHTGYPSVKGPVLNGEQLETIAEGLSANGLMCYDYLLTGYIGNESFLSSIIKVWNLIVKANPNAIFMCDPVMGDNGKYYVDPAMAPIYKTVVMPLASIITPNQFEAEEITGLKINTVNDALNTMSALHQLGPRIVIVTSCHLEGNMDTLHCFISYPTGDDTQSNGGDHAVSHVEIAKIDGNYTGTGDLTAALLLAWLHKLYLEPRRLHLADGDLNQALINVLSSVRAVICRTDTKRLAKLALPLPPPSQSSGVEGEVIYTAEQQKRLQKARATELCLIQSKQDIEVPPVASLQPLSQQTHTYVVPR